MKLRVLVFWLIVSLLVGVLAAPGTAKKKKKAKPRVAQGEYVLPNAGFWAGQPGNDPQVGGVSFTTGADERFVSVEIEDMISPTVWALVGQDPDGDGQVTEATSVCGKSAAPIPIQPGYDVTVFLIQGPCDFVGEPAFGTTGTVTATFTARP